MPLRLRSLTAGAMAVVALGACLVLRTGRSLHTAHPRGGGSAVRPPDLHVCICTGDTDARAAFVAIRSAVGAARNPAQILFHVITSPHAAPVLEQLLRPHLPEARVEVHSRALVQEKIERAIRPPNSSGLEAGIGLVDPFAFAPFYLLDFLGWDSAASGHRGSGADSQRVVYLDSDVVVRGDLGELSALDLGGHAVAAVRDCLQHYGELLDFGELGRLGFGTPNPNACALSTGILVLDVARWKQQGITAKVDEWLMQYKNFDERIDHWYTRLSHLPWLAISADCTELAREWSCHSLGHKVMTAAESRRLREGGFDHEVLGRLGVSYTRYGKIKPFVATCGAAAKLLHFGGTQKPWSSNQQSLCSVGEATFWSKWSWKKDARVYCKHASMTFVGCAELWSMYISEEQACALRSFEDEWQVEEEQWDMAWAKHQRRQLQQERRRNNDKLEAKPDGAGPSASGHAKAKKQKAHRREGRPMQSRRSKLKDTWADVRTRLSRLGTAQLRRSLSILGLPTSGGKEQLVSAILRFLEQKEGARLERRMKKRW